MNKYDWALLGLEWGWFAIASIGIILWMMNGEPHFMSYLSMGMILSKIGYIEKGKP